MFHVKPADIRPAQPSVPKRKLFSRVTPGRARLARKTPDFVGNQPVACTKIDGFARKSARL
jgi:hypothetical protein